MSYEYKSALVKLGIIANVGKSTICYDNAAMESMNGIIKSKALYSKFEKTRVKERRINISDFGKKIISFIAYYNEKRPKKLCATCFLLNSEGKIQKAST